MYISYHTILYYTILYNTRSYCIVLFSTVLYYTQVIYLKLWPASCFAEVLCTWSCPLHRNSVCSLEIHAIAGSSRSKTEPYPAHDVRSPLSTHQQSLNTPQITMLHLKLLSDHTKHPGSDLVAEFSDTSSRNACRQHLSIWQMLGGPVLLGAPGPKPAPA